MADAKFSLRIVSLQTEAGLRGAQFAKVNFQVGNGPSSFEVPVYVDRANLDDAEIVITARRLFAQMVRILSEQTMSWRATEPSPVSPEEAGK